jgi:hypothetical protein
MKFTATEMTNIERTMDKLTNVAFTVWERESTDAANTRAIAYMISELRACAHLMQSDDRETQLAANARAVSFIVGLIAK